MIKAVIVDDEKKSREVLRKLIEEYSQGIVILGEASSVKEGVKLINEELPQLVFLDVEMLDGTGFNLLEQFNKVYFQVIFITAYDKYAIKAFKYSAVDYLLKPIAIDELEEAIIRAQNAVDKNVNYKNQVDALLGNITPEKTNKKLVLKSADKINLVKIEDIVCCEADGNYTIIYMFDEEKILVSKPLKYFNLIFNGHNQFFRASKSCLIKLDYVKMYKKDKSLAVMVNGKEVEISRRKRKEFLENL